MSKDDLQGAPPEGTGLSPSGPSPTVSSAAAASIPRAGLDLSDGLVCAVIAYYRMTRRTFGDGSPEAVKARGHLYDLEGLCRTLAAERCASDERPTGPRPSGLGGDSPASAVDAVEAPGIEVTEQICLDKLKRENADLREALRPFAEAVFEVNGLSQFSSTQPNLDDWLRARTLLSQPPEGGETS